MEILSVQNLNKHYPKFDLKNVSFSLEQGYIMGFIGRNGAGKTTTIKSIMRLVHPDSGTVAVMGKNFADEEFVCKQQIGLVLGQVSYYPTKKLSVIADVTRRFYPEWDANAFAGYLKRFDLDPDKTVKELSDGMRVKFALAMALSHNARLLILDEPTSGLDPVSRDDLLELFQELIENSERSILFSTQITSDLDKCADYITYIKNGEIIASTSRDDLVNSYKIVKGTRAQLTETLLPQLIGCKKNDFGFTALLRTDNLPNADGLEIAPADLESIMIHIEKE
ncbi:ABC transporter ATP-binding protein [Ornatilinea apprima]|uniref:ABC transporter ATP-binding protein n=1 Tax=Ornatilinea apprima TaxID=1134406 RepID=A0A0P6XSB4_9CHLR|nr:ABC transporter ATP-binding protein [Ornatilinea apprima]KPL78080.1 ABC transporter ATP-binding protein [Ornatilinea apprima]